jgi:dUTP pyrophosphatase
MLPLYNDSDETQRVYHGDRIAQMIIQPYEHCVMTEVKKLSDTERGKGGFGSTGR